MNDAFVHPSATVDDGASIGAGTSVWHNAHVRSAARIGEGCTLGNGVYIGTGVTVGDHCKIQNRAMLFEGSSVADGVFVGPGAQLANDRFPRAVTPEGVLKGADDWTVGSVHVEGGASIGAAAVIVPDTRIGRWAMVGAGAVVTRDVAPHELVVGNPARHAGYVCMCGRRLAPAADAWQCTVCGRTVRLGGGNA